MSIPPPEPRKRRFRLSVRGLMVLVLLIGGGLGWFEHRARVQRDAVAVIERARGRVQYNLDDIENATLGSWVNRLVNAVGPDRVGTVIVVGGGFGFRDEQMKAVDRLPYLEVLDLKAAEVTDVGLANLGRLTRLKYLELDGTKATRAIVSELKGLHRLESLELGGLDITDAEVAHLAGLTQLRCVSLSGGGITDVGLSHLVGLVRLEDLRLAETSVTTAGLVSLSPMSRLRHLKVTDARVTSLAPLRGMGALQSIEVSGCPITDAGLEGVGRLAGLSWLDLGGCRSVSDAGLVHLKGLVELWSLDLEGTKVTGPGLANLGGMKTLNGLNLSSTPITDAGLVHLRGLTCVQRLELNGTPIGDAAVPHLLGVNGPILLELQETKLTDAGLLRLANSKRFGMIFVRATAVTPEGVQAALLANPGTDVVGVSPPSNHPGGPR